MATYTKYKNLEKPFSTEKYNVAVTNKNNDVIDSELHKLELKNQSQDELLATKEDLNSEITRAMVKETELVNDLASEITRAKSAENENSNHISNETARAIISENDIFHSIQEHISDTASSHSDIRLLISEIASKVNTVETNANKTTYTNNLTATVEGTALDAVQGKVLDGKGAQMSVYKGEDGNLHFRDWSGADTVIPFSGNALNKDELTISFTVSGQSDIVAVYSGRHYSGGSASINVTLKIKNDQITVEGSTSANHSGSYVNYSDMYGGQTMCSSGSISVSNFKIIGE